MARIVLCCCPFKNQNTDVPPGRCSGNYSLSESIISLIWYLTLLSPTYPLPFLILQLSTEDYSSMSRLLPPLEILSQKHSDVVIQELASNLRAVICTHGAYWPENLTAASQPSRIPERTAKNNSVPSKKKQNIQTEANISESCSHSSSPDSNSPCNTHITHPITSGVSLAGITQRAGGRTNGTSVLCHSFKPLSDWLLEACDPDVPTRAFALRLLTQMVQNENPEAVQAQEKVLMVGCSVINFIFFNILFYHIVS